MAETGAGPEPGEGDGETEEADGPRAFLQPLLRPLLLPLLIAGTGCLVGQWMWVDSQTGSGFYGYLTSGLLAVGLYGSASGVSRPEGSSDVYRIVVAITFGVGVKAAFIALVLRLFFRGEPEYLVLAVAMAQIDPLSVSAMLESRDMSRRAKSLLAAWASFDDPVTTVLVVILGSMVLTGTGSITSGTTEYVQTLLGNLALLVGAALMWFIVRASKGQGNTPPGPKRGALQITALVALLALATWQFWMLGLAVSALFFRPPLGRWLNRATDVALWVATFLLGMLLAEGADFAVGIVLGCATFVAQILVGSVVSLGFPRRDLISLSLSQQNGITAIILALLLEPALPEAVAVVAPAILVVNLLHLTSNALLAQIRHRQTASRGGAGSTGASGRNGGEALGAGKEPPTPETC